VPTAQAVLVLKEFEKTLLQLENYSEKMQQLLKA
jgi:hypothetical protein